MYLSIYLSASLKTKLSCETSSVFSFKFDNIKNAAIQQDFLNFFALDNIKNEATLRDFLFFKVDNIKKQSNSARCPSKMES